jgi:hypothetical protein
VQRKITSLWSERKVVLRQTARAVTPFGGLRVFVEFLGKIGYSERVRRDLPVHLKSPNAIDPGETFTAFVLSVVAGAQRFAHPAVAGRADRAFGSSRFPAGRRLRTLVVGRTQRSTGSREATFRWEAAVVPASPNRASLPGRAFTKRSEKSAWTVERVKSSPYLRRR